MQSLNNLVDQSLTSFFVPTCWSTNSIIHPEQPPKKTLVKNKMAIQSLSFLLQCGCLGHVVVEVANVVLFASSGRLSAFVVPIAMCNDAFGVYSAACFVKVHLTVHAAGAWTKTSTITTTT